MTQYGTVARRYATALLDLAKERGDTEAVGRDLRAASSAIAGDDDTRRFFTSPVVNRQKKLETFEKALAGFDEIARNVALLLIKKRREALLDSIVAEYETLALAERGSERLQISSARALPQSELEAILERLSRHFKKEFEVHQNVDPALLGGVRITLGDRRIDATISGRLDEFARDLHRQKDLNA